jgi:hypothetical protein
MERQFHFIDGTTVYICPDTAYILQYIDIGKGLAGIEENGIAVLESSGEFPVLLPDLLCMVYIERGAKIRSQLSQVAWG